MKKAAKVALGVAGGLTIIGLGAWLLNSKFHWIKPADYQPDAKKDDISTDAQQNIVVTNYTDEEIITTFVEPRLETFGKQMDQIVSQVPTINPAGYMRLVVCVASSRKEADELLDLLDKSGTYTTWVETSLSHSYNVGIEVMRTIADASEHFEEKCAQTTFVDNPTVSTEATTVVTNTNKKAFLGAVKKTSSEKTTTERTTVAHQMVPHCTDYVIDPGKLTAKLGMLAEAAKQAYAAYSRTLGSEPDITEFKAYLALK